MTAPRLLGFGTVTVGEEPGHHTPVLTSQVGELLGVRAGDTVADLTVGLGGHARLLAEALGSEGTLIGLDADPAALGIARQTLSGAACQVKLLHADFAELRDALPSAGVEQVDVLFADLGVSSAQLEDAARGFSFQTDGPLDMRIDPRLTVTAADLINRVKERELGDLLYYNAQERAARRIARRICEARRDKRITTTGRLANVVVNALGVDPSGRRERIHPATRTFLALRIAVNNEIRSLEAMLLAAPDVLRPGGRIGIIAFHSVEDRPVKLDFRRRKSEKVYRIVTKRPVIADPEERRRNPRSRSAKLRVAVRLPEKEGANVASC